MPRKRSPKLVSFRPDRERAKGVEVALYDACREAVETHGDRLAGFVLLTLDVFDDALCRNHLDGSRIGMAYLPKYAHDAISRQIAIDAVAEDQEQDSGTG
jgi:hypothetical protein